MNATKLSPTTAADFQCRHQWRRDRERGKNELEREQDKKKRRNVVVDFPSSSSSSTSLFFNAIVHTPPFDSSLTFGFHDNNMHSPLVLLYRPVHLRTSIYIQISIGTFLRGAKCFSKTTLLPKSPNWRDAEIVRFLCLLLYYFISLSPDYYYHSY